MSALAEKVLTVPASLSGVLLQDFLARAFPDIVRADLRLLLGRDGVRVNGMPERRNLRLRAHDHVEVQALTGLRQRPQAANPGPGPLPVLFATGEELVVDKPPGLPTIPDRSGQEPSVHGRLGELRPDGDLRIVHRLDRDTSGCLILADGLEAARHYDEAFRGGRVDKSYLALVTGVVAGDRDVELFLAPDPRRPGKVVAFRTRRKGSRAASTEVRVVERFAGHTLVRLLPHTGRGHQLRVHLATIGHPIVADADYGGAPLLLSQIKRGYKRRRGVEELPLLRRMFLHCERLAFATRASGPAEVRSPLPADLDGALRKLRRFAVVSGDGAAEEGR